MPKGFPAGLMPFIPLQSTAHCRGFPSTPVLPQGALCNLRNAGSAGTASPKSSCRVQSKSTPRVQSILSSGLMYFPAEFPSLMHILGAFPFGTGVSGAPNLTCPCPKSHLCSSARLKEQEDHVCKVLFSQVPHGREIQRLQ